MYTLDEVRGLVENYLELRHLSHEDVNYRVADIQRSFRELPDFLATTAFLFGVARWPAWRVARYMDTGRTTVYDWYDAALLWLTVYMNEGR